MYVMCLCFEYKLQSKTANNMRTIKINCKYYEDYKNHSITSKETAFLFQMPSFSSVMLKIDREKGLQASNNKIFI